MIKPMPKQTRVSSKSARNVAAAQRYEALVVTGLEDLAAAELRQLPGVRDVTTSLPGAVAFSYSGTPAALSTLQTVIAVFLVADYPVPRPRALLGDQHFRHLCSQIESVRRHHPAGAFATLYLAAAGSETAVMERLRNELLRATRLAAGSGEGDLLLRLRRPPTGGDGWQALIRLTPRPLATRAWRVCNLEGALNATVAHAMALLAPLRATDRVLNLACGSGTLLIERLAAGPAAQSLGCDTSPTALDCARRNIVAAGIADQVELQAWDARNLPLPDQSIDLLTADLPFGQLVGSHAENLDLYPVIFSEAARIARPQAVWSLITHEVRLTEQLLLQSADWAIDSVRRITLGGLHPRIFLLRRRE